MTSGPVLVLGGAGFIGGYLLRRLVKEGDEVRVLDVEKAPEPVAGVRYIQGSILDEHLLSDAMSYCKQIYHLAAHLPVAQGDVQSSHHLMTEINVAGTKTVLDLARRHNIKRVVYMSSTAVYGIPSANPIVDKTPFAPQETYGASKVEAEHLCAGFAKDGGEMLILRPCPVIGPGRLGVFQILFEWILQGYNLPILGRGDNILDFIHVEDCADAIIAMAKSPHNAGRLRAYNVGANDAVSLRQGLERVISKVGSKSKVRSFPKAPVVWSTLIACKLKLLPIAPFHALCYGESIYVSTQTLQQDFDWQPNHEFVSMLVDSFHWYCANRDDILERKSGSAHQVRPKQGLLSVARFIP